jgi:hypothetical protein
MRNGLRVAMSNAFHTMSNSYYSTRISGCQIVGCGYEDTMKYTTKDVIDSSSCVLEKGDEADPLFRVK